MKNGSFFKCKWIKEEGFYLLLLLLICLIGYGRFLFNAPIYDFYNHFFPYRYFIVDTIHHGRIPLWNPYQSMGLPAHADPQANVFYLPIWIFALIFGKYSTACCGAEFLFHVFVSGVGFFYLTRFFVKNNFVAFLTAGFYMLSGFFVGNAQHLSWIIGAAWLPWLLLSFIKLLDSPGLRPMLLFPLFFSLMVTGGYPGFVFVSIYFLLAILIFYLVIRFQQSRQDWGKLFGYGAGALVLSVLLSAPALISFWEIRAEITRGVSLSFAETSESLTLRSMISLIFPYIANSDSGFTHTDISMGSIYVGLLVLPAVFIGLWKNRDSLLWVLLGMGLWAFISAFGTHIPLNRFFFEHLPLLGVIRLPGLYRLFFMLIMLIFAAKGFEYLIENWEKCRVCAAYISGAAGLLFLIAVAVFYKMTPEIQHDDFLDGPLTQKMMLEAMIASFTCIIASLAIIIAGRPKVFVLLAIILLAEPLVQANICGPKTIYTTQDLHEQLAKVTSISGFPVPDSLSSPEKINKDYGLYAFWTNVGMFVKEVEWYSYNPVKLNRDLQMLQKYCESQTALYLPIAYFPKAIVYDTVPHFLTTDTAYTLRPESVFTCDSGNTEITVRRFEPGYVVLQTQTDTERPFALCQSVYKGWQASLDGNPLQLDTLNFAMLSATVPAGSHEVVLEYRRPFIVALFMLQAILSAIMFLLFSYLKFRSC
ncbi:MAG: YfhO family protein [Bacteroidales bacterium]|nr:YfhO family protein [Bacteroidales bacterium]